MTLRAVIGSIRVLVSYDMPTRYRLYRLLQADPTILLEIHRGDGQAVSNITVI